jgi:hypothetical protein
MILLKLILLLGGAGCLGFLTLRALRSGRFAFGDDPVERSTRPRLFWTYFGWGAALTAYQFLLLFELISRDA